MKSVSDPLAVFPYFSDETDKVRLSSLEQAYSNGGMGYIDHDFLYALIYGAIYYGGVVSVSMKDRDGNIGYLKVRDPENIEKTIIIDFDRMPNYFKDSSVLDRFFSEWEIVEIRNDNYGIKKFIASHKDKIEYVEVSGEVDEEKTRLRLLALLAIEKLRLRLKV